VPGTKIYIGCPHLRRRQLRVCLGLFKSQRTWIGYFAGGRRHRRGNKPTMEVLLLFSFFFKSCLIRRDTLEWTWRWRKAATWWSWHGRARSSWEPSPPATPGQLYRRAAASSWSSRPKRARRPTASGKPPKTPNHHPQPPATPKKNQRETQPQPQKTNSHTNQNNQNTSHNKRRKKEEGRRRRKKKEEEGRRRKKKEEGRRKKEERKKKKKRVCVCACRGERQRGERVFVNRSLRLQKNLMHEVNRRLLFFLRKDFSLSLSLALSLSPLSLSLSLSLSLARGHKSLFA